MLAIPARLRKHAIRCALLAIIVIPLIYLYSSSGGAFSHIKRPLPPGLPAEKEVVIAATKKSDVRWIHEAAPDWAAIVYRVDDWRARWRTPVNKGREAMVYLTYMIDRYDTLPEIAVFLHDKRYQWHNDNPLYDNALTLHDLQLSYVQEAGYVNLRCAHLFGCPAELSPGRYFRERPADEDHPTAVAYPDAFLELFPGTLLPEEVGVPCCSQFAVSRAQILARPREEYVRFREWLAGTKLDDATSGRVFEYLWHMLFGKPPVHCAEPRECYCKTFGYCNLTDEEVEKQWVWRGLKLPDGWPEVQD